SSIRHLGVARCRPSLPQFSDRLRVDVAVGGEDRRLIEVVEAPVHIGNDPFGLADQDDPRSNISRMVCSPTLRTSLYPNSRNVEYSTESISTSIGDRLEL